jgi:adenylate kinase family enzyme
MRRVLLIGSPGSGKSTLARALSAATGLPVVHLDRLYWRPGWVEPSPEEWRPALDEALATPEWIMDGTYGGTIAHRLQRADTVVFLDFPTSVCLGRALRRIFVGWGRDRPDLTPGCPERIDLAFLVYVARFRSRKRPGLLQRLEGFPGTVCHFTRTEKVAALVGKILDLTGR